MLCSRSGWLHSFAVSLALETIPTLTFHSVSGVWVTGHAGNGHRTLSWCTFGQHEKDPGTAETEFWMWTFMLLNFEDDAIPLFHALRCRIQQVSRSTSIIFVSFSFWTQVGATHVLSHLKAGTNVGRLPAADDVATSTTDPCWWVGDYQPNSVVEHVGRWKFKTLKYGEIWWNMERPRKKTWDPLMKGILT